MINCVTISHLKMPRYYVMSSFFGYIRSVTVLGISEVNTKETMTKEKSGREI